MIQVWDVTIPKLTGNEVRKAYIYLPESYDQNSEQRYPVLYMFDGQNVFFDSDATYGKSWGLKEYMEYSNTQMIVAAVACNQHPDNSRLQEYSPFTFKDSIYGSIKGLGHLTMKWFVNSFKPDIDKAFRTMPDRKHTFIAGSSMGGLMSLYAITKYNHIFSRGGLLSPSIWVAPKRLSQLIQNASIAPDTVAYMDYGSKEEDHHNTMLRQFPKVTSQLLKKGVLLTSRIVPNGTHCEACWERQLPIFMNCLLYDLQ